MKFNPEDGQTYGPHCRNCHKGSSACGTCHSYNGNETTSALTPSGWIGAYNSYAASEDDAADNSLNDTTYDVAYTSDDQPNPLAAGYSTATGGFIKNSREADWYADWRTATGFVQMGQKMTTGNESGVGTDCSDDGVSWPHRTLGWKMLKDDLFGIDLAGNVVTAGEYRTADGLEKTTTATGNYQAHDIDSVCLDCHNPTVWNASKNTTDPDDPTKNTHYDGAGDVDNYDDELLLRGLP